MAVKSSLHQSRASPLIGGILLANLVANCGLFVYSHVGLSFGVYSNQNLVKETPAPAPKPTPAPTPPPTAAATTAAPSATQAPAPAPTPKPSTCPSRRLSAMEDDAFRRLATEPRLLTSSDACTNDADKAVISDPSVYQAKISECGQQCVIELLGGQTGCLTTCLQNGVGLTQACSSCYASMAVCSTACVGECLAAPFGATCMACQTEKGCTAAVNTCTGLVYECTMTNRNCPTTTTTVPVANSTTMAGDVTQAPQGQGNSAGTNPQTTAATTAAPATQAPAAAVKAEQEWYGVGEFGEISFANTVEKVWDSGATILALVIIIGSGAGPYLECVMLGLAYFVPMSKEARARMLWWINRVGRWSFIEVFVVVLVIAGLSKLSLLQGSIYLAVKSEGGIYAFTLGTIWARFMGVFVEECHRRTAGENAEASKLSCQCMGSLSLNKLRLLMLPTSVVLLGVGIAATVGPMVTFTASDPFGDDIREYSSIEMAWDSSDRDLAGVASHIFLAVPYIIWGVLLPIVCGGLLLVSLVCTKFAPNLAKALLNICDSLGSASCWDTMLVAVVLMARHFGDLIHLAICGADPRMADLVTASCELQWGFFLILAATPFQWLMQEGALALHEKVVCESLSNKAIEKEDSPEC